MQISQSRFYQIIKKWIFSNSTRKGQLKNVQDGISRPQGDREIQETKAGTVLLDTLFVLVLEVGAGTKITNLTLAILLF